MTVTVHREKAHVLTLDSIRGIAAVTVVIHHVILMPTFLAAFPNRAWIDCAFFRSGGFLVDLFFVLSGMVMSLSYVQSDFGRFSLRDFMVRRFARVYPLHIVMLFVTLLFRLVRIGLVMAGIIVAVPTVFEVNNAYSFFLNVFLLHSLGFVHYLNWNAPSWSISVEFYTYLVFGVVVLIAQRLGSLRWLYVLALLLAAASWFTLAVILDKRDLGAQYDFGLLRCFTSFFLGVLTVKIVSLLPSSIRGANVYLLGAFQLASMVATVGNVWLVEAYPWISFAAPLTFAVFLGSLLAFPNAAVVPPMLVARPLVWLGARSYSIYMVHAFVVLLAEYFVRALGARPVAALDAVYPGLSTTLNLVVVLAAVLVLSNLTFRYIELPGGRWTKNILGRIPNVSSSSAVPSARPSN
ncbi:acyltransferase family protein [Bradyrhizobium rifense]|uniref:acyltransferase family protein n=1 Tax=Bradyrhizobium rifense TaxID=515499 RepID=UPI001FE9FF08|nr:acyltransferase [Bradyrhizobium rifense]